MATEPEFGVRDDGFAPKGFDTILAESLERARAVLGADVDLTITSPLRKVFEVTAAEDAELWKRLEDGYFANFVSTAPGDALDLLGEDVGLVRRESFAAGEAEFTLSGGVPGRSYLVPEGTVVVTAAPVRAFTTLAGLTLTAARPIGRVRIEALERGLADLPPGAVTAVDPGYAAVYLGDLGPASLAVTNPVALTGGRVPEGHDVYRGRLLGTSRSLWTLEAVRQSVLGVDGVIDVLLSDPLGGVDVSQGYFGMFDFGRRLFSAERRVGEPYFFDVVVAHEYRWPWRTTGPVPGVLERVTAAVDLVRPPGVRPNVVAADHIDVGVRAGVVLESGYDGEAVLAAVRSRLAAEAGGARLGGDVLYARVVRAFAEEPGVVDVRRLHLRRHPPAFGRISFGEVAHQTQTVEVPVGENLVMGPTELAVFRTDSALHDLRVVTG
ncbi:baseplate J/gp47 family protein [Streptomyces sp. JNUCC 64]